MGNATASRGLEVAVANLQDYCNGIKKLQQVLLKLTKYVLHEIVYMLIYLKE